MQESTNEQTERPFNLFYGVPPVRKVSEEEIQRRRVVVDRILRRQKETGPIGIRADDLLHEARIDADR